MSALHKKRREKQELLTSFLMPERGIYLGIKTVSTTWMTPLDWITSAMVTLALTPFSSVTMTSLPSMVAVKVPPATVFMVALPLPSLMALAMVAASILPGTTWYVRMPVSLALFSGLSSVSTVPFGSLSKASLVGAKTVKGPAPLSVSTR